MSLNKEKVKWAERAKEILHNGLLPDQKFKLLAALQKIADESSDARTHAELEEIIRHYNVNNFILKMSFSDIEERFQAETEKMQNMGQEILEKERREKEQLKSCTLLDMRDTLKELTNLIAQQRKLMEHQNDHEKE